MPSTDIFDEHQSAWAEYTSTPWARIRYAVVAATLRRSLDSLGAGSARVLDVGGGDGLDSLPLAECGHEVTVLDPSEAMLAAGERRASAAGVRATFRQGGIDDLPGLGEFDLVVCHHVLQYRDDLAGDLALLLGAVRGGGLLSLVAPNPASTVLTRLLRAGPAEALAELGRDTIHAVTFDREVRKLTFEDVEAVVRALGGAIVGRYGGRIANDLVVDDTRKLDPAFYAELEQLELALCDREPFWRLGAFWQLVARRPD